MAPPEPRLSRSQWVRALTAADPQALAALADALAERHRAQASGPAVSGAALLPLRESVTNAAFYLGETPLASASVELQTPDGRPVAGAAAAMGVDAHTAMRLAVLDGVLAHDLPGSEDVAALMASGQTKLAETDARRAAIRARTRVEFSALDAADPPAPG